MDGVSKAGWAQNGANRYYLDGNGHYLTGWNVIAGQPYAFDASGALKQGWDRTSGKIYYFIDGISQSGTISDGVTQYELNGCGSLGGVSAVQAETPAVSEETTLPEETPAASGTEQTQQPAEQTPAAEPAEQPAAAPAQETAPGTTGETENDLERNGEIA